MRRIGILWSFVVFTAVLGFAYFGGANNAEARPNYKKAFEAKYPEVKKNNKITCNVCHMGKSKKMRNEYGKAVAKALGVKKCKDVEKINASFDKVAEENEEFAKRLKEGKLPVE